MALYVSVTLYIRVTAQLPENRSSYLLHILCVYSGHLHITDAVTLWTSRSTVSLFFTCILRSPNWITIKSFANHDKFLQQLIKKKS